MLANRRRSHVLLAFAALTASLAAQGTPIGFEETYALAPDRAQAVAPLIPGTDDWYYYHARERLDARDFATVRALLPAWIQRHDRNARVREIEFREALLSYGDDPERTFAFVRDRLGLRFDHQRVVPGERTDLPSQLDAALLTNETLTQRAWQLHPGDVSGFTDRALPALARTELDGNQLHALLQRLDRADVDNLPALVVRDLDHRQSRGFGSLPVHGQLRIAQLEECARLRPGLLQERGFVEAWLARLQPNADTDWQVDDQARAAYLGQLWSFAQRLAPAFNSLKAHVLYHWLQYDLAHGAPDKDRFLAYVKLPRRSGHPAPQHLRRFARPEEQVDTGASFATGMPVIGDDEPLVRACLEHFFASEDGYTAYAEFLHDEWLKQVLAETKLMLGQGDAERWYSMLPSPASLAELERRVEIDFATASRSQYGADEAVRIDVDVKNVPTLLMKVFTIDAFRYHVERQREVDATMDLDGVVANHEQTFTYGEAPIRRVRRSFDLPMLREPGTYVVEFVGNGISSRAVIHKGGLRCVERMAAGGQLFRVYDETGAHVPQASIWFGGRDYAADANGEILLPFSTSPGRHLAVLHHGNRSSLAPFAHEAESYALHGGVHVDREALVAGRKARMLVRPELRLGDHPVSLKLVQQPVLTLTATDLDGLQTVQEVRDLQLVDGRELVHEFTVPERLASLSARFSGKVKDLNGTDVPLQTAPRTFAINGIDATALTGSALLLRTEAGYVLEARGKDGEPKVGLACQLQLHHRDYSDPLPVALQTDENGRIALGALNGITVVELGSGGFHGAFPLDRATCRLPGELLGLAGEVLRLPYQGRSPQPAREQFSLTSVGRDEFSHLAIADGFLELRGLEPGDYELVLHEEGRTIPVRVTQGVRDGRWLVGRDRVLEATDAAPLQLRSLTIEGTDLLLRVANPSANTRVHVAAARFAPAFPVFRDLYGNTWDLLEPRR